MPGAGRYFLAATIAPPVPLNEGTEHAKMGPKIEELDDTLPDLEEDTSTADSPTVRPNVRRAPMEDLRNNLSSRSPPRSSLTSSTSTRSTPTGLQGRRRPRR